MSLFMPWKGSTPVMSCSIRHPMAHTSALDVNLLSISSGDMNLKVPLAWPVRLRV